MTNLWLAEKSIRFNNNQEGQASLENTLQFVKEEWIKEKVMKIYQSHREHGIKTYTGMVELITSRNGFVLSLQNCMDSTSYLLFSANKKEMEEIESYSRFLIETNFD